MAPRQRDRVEAWLGRQHVPRTVRNQLASVYTKLGVGTRIELAARYPWLADD